MSKLPQTDAGLRRYLRQEQRKRIREEGKSPYSRSGLSVTDEGSIVASGQIQSDDYDGTSPTALGTTGWALAKRADLLSRIVLNGVDLQADLDAKDVAILGLIDELSDAQADLAAAQADLAAQAAYQASLISRDASSPTFNTGTLANDSAWHLVGTEAVIGGIAIPTGKARVTISLSEASITPGANSVIAAICFAIDSVSTLSPTARYARLYSGGYQIGSSLSRTDTVTLTPGTYTIRAQCAYWSAGASTASVNFTSLRLLAEVIGSD